MKKTILLLPGTKWQMDLARTIRERGYNLYVADPSENAPCRAYADKFLQSDIFDNKKIDAFIERNPIDAVVSDECDIATPVIARIGEKFHLATIGSAEARLFTDKYKMKEFCRQIGLNYPEYRLCKTEEEVLLFLREIKKPIIIKPIDCNASKGVHTVKSEQDIEKYFEETLSYSRIEKAVLAERYINGTEFTIDGIKTLEAHYTLAISEKKHFKHNCNIADELLFSYSNEKFDYERLRNVNDLYILKSKLPFGLTHAEYKYENGKFYLIEIAARGGGNMISSVISQYLSGYHTYEYLLDCALGECTERTFEISGQLRDRVAVLKFFHTPHGGGRVKKIHGIDYLEKEADIKKYALNFSEGDIIGDCESDSARIGYYIACSETMEGLNAVMDHVEKKFRIEME
ncbi:MAG: ATP-grasp domain-containing protein [Lachnospiraceae bacterium]